MELLILLAVIGILSGIGVTAMNTDLLTGSREAKMRHDLGVLNSAVKSYLASGGNLDGVDEVPEVVSKLKTVVTDSEVALAPGFTGSFLDRRAEAVMQSEEEGASDAPRLLWDSHAKKFVLAESGRPGLKKLRLSADGGELRPVTEERRHFMNYAAKDDWVWDYTEASPSYYRGPSQIPTSNPAPTPPILPTPVPPPPQALSPPGFSLPGGSYPAHAFNLDIYLTNPNPAGASQIVYSVNYGSWTDYSEGTPLTVFPGSVIQAQSVPVDRYAWNASTIHEENFESYLTKLKAPLIDFNHPYFTDEGDTPVDTITVTITDTNAPGLSSLSYQIVPVPGGDGPTTDFSGFSGPFDVRSNLYPDGFGIRAYAKTEQTGYEDSRMETKFATAEGGLFGGHLDLDTSLSIAEVSNGSTEAHTHDITGKHGVSGIDFFAIPEDKQIEIQEAITNPNQAFKISVVNANLSPGINIKVNYEVNGEARSIDLPVNEYDDTSLAGHPTFTLGGSTTTARLVGLEISMAQDVIYSAGVIPTNTGDVKGNILGRDFEWRNGSLTVQALAMNPDGSEGFTTTDSFSNGDHGVATSGLLWEAALFWHWDGDSYHEENNQYSPGQLRSILEHVDDPGGDFLSRLLNDDNGWHHGQYRNGN